MPPCVTVTEPSAYTLTAALIGGGAQSNLQAMAVGSRRSLPLLTAIGTTLIGWPSCGLSVKH